MSLRDLIKHSGEHEQPLRTSDLLLQLAAEETKEDISLGDILDRLGDRAFGPILLIFALPMVLPMPPGVSTLFGLPQMIIAWQLLMGRESCWLPRLVAERRFSRKLFRKVVRKTVLILKPIEHLLKPRFHFMTQGWPEKITAFLLLVMAAIVFLPVPGFNMLPSLAITIVAIGYIERDGLIIMLGNLVALTTVGLIGLSFKLIIVALEKLWHWITIPFAWKD